MNNLFDEQSSLFEIRNYFKDLDKKTTLNFVEWIEDSSDNNIELEIHPLDYVVEIIKYLKLPYNAYSSEINIIEEQVTEKPIKPLFKTVYIRTFKRTITLISISWNGALMKIDVEKKEHLKLAKDIAIEISNYIGCNVKLKLKSEFR